MCPPAASPLADIGFDCHEELFMSLKEMTSGFPLPSNVITDLNPRNYLPSNLPADIWYLVHHRGDENTELGLWKVKGIACKLFSNSVITGWRNTLEFFEGHVPHERKTDWMMHEYWITEKGLGENSKAKEASLLCRVFLGGGRDLVNEKQQKMAGPPISSGTHLHLKLSGVLKAPSGISDGSTSHLEVNMDDDGGKLALAERPLNHLLENQAKDYVDRGDYLELADLDKSASSSPISDNSSCCTMSSGECFDSLALLQDLKSESSHGLVQKNDDCKFSITSSLTPNEVVMFPVSSESITSVDASKQPSEEILRTELPAPGLADGHKQLDNRVLQHAVRHQKSDYKDEGASSNCLDEGTSSKRCMASRDGKKKAASKSRMKKLKEKYLCFMPFYFLF